MKLARFRISTVLGCREQFDVEEDWVPPEAVLVEGMSSWCMVEYADAGPLSSMSMICIGEVLVKGLRRSDRRDVIVPQLTILTRSL